MLLPARQPWFCASEVGSCLGRHPESVGYTVAPSGPVQVAEISWADGAASASSSYDRPDAMGNGAGYVADRCAAVVSESDAGFVDALVANLAMPMPLPQAISQNVPGRQVAAEEGCEYNTAPVLHRSVDTLFTPNNSQCRPEGGAARPRWEKPRAVSAGMAAAGATLVVLYHTHRSNLHGYVQHGMTPGFAGIVGLGGPPGAGAGPHHW